MVVSFVEKKQSWRVLNDVFAFKEACIFFARDGLEFTYVRTYSGMVCWHPLMVGHFSGRGGSPVFLGGHNFNFVDVFGILFCLVSSFSIVLDLFQACFYDTCFPIESFTGK